jgi:hypothetical protein
MWTLNVVSSSSAPGGAVGRLDDAGAESAARSVRSDGNDAGGEDASGARGSASGRGFVAAGAAHAATSARRIGTEREAADRIERRP